MQEHVVSIGDWTEIPFDLPAGTSFLVGGLACLFACDEKGKGGAYSGLGVPCCFFFCMQKCRLVAPWPFSALLVRQIQAVSSKLSEWCGFKRKSPNWESWGLF